MTGQKPARYSVIVIPDNSAVTRRVEIPRWAIKAAVGGLAGLLMLSLVSVWGWVYYRHSYMATEDIRVQNVAFDQERAALLAKLTNLEQMVSRVDRFTTKIESGADSKGELSRGIGPIAETLELPQLPSLGSLNTLSMATPNSPMALNDLTLKLDSLKETAEQVEDRLQRVYELRQDRKSYWASLPSIWPVQGWVTSDFGHRRSPLRGGTRFHAGLDIASPTGTPIRAPGDGVVIYAGYKGGYGKVLVVDHGYGISTLYGHNSEIFVAEGDRIKRGSVIATIGMTGRTTGAHLHYQIMVDGVPVDPMKYIAERF